MSNSLLTDSWTLQDGINMTVLQNPLRTRILVTGVGEKFYVPPHWHAAHDEIHIVIKGRAIVIQDGVRRIVGPEDGACLTRRGVIHSLEGFPGEELILEETATAPEDVSFTNQGGDSFGCLLCDADRTENIFLP
jgi:mannose-6-phosphate isomerase-like protein (cupin superfamily)